MYDAYYEGEYEWDSSTVLTEFELLYMNVYVTSITIFVKKQKKLQM